ncbi:DUF6088 family protein [Chelatococcus asaccharovorans]|uniref:DUF6088 family protein n=1 Tax=Chelatococcus asaccharovorans TaxID=28210 RepID=UPI00224C6C22|nr:DUF6088 family protein [Chelatococcus asaccharovorans]CAH1674251.1 conserved hypothetical protein [Chelatococcus asaccharovorans]CAH1674366.1 conserved hypothetical protein [Chelatococcus asaccharovorans]
MQRLTDQIMAHVEGLPAGTGVSAKAVLHLGNRDAVDQALSRLARRGRLVRAGRGLFLLPVHGRFGTRAPSIEESIRAMAAKGGEVIVPSGASAANRFGLTTQVPVRSIYLTSGRSRIFHLGLQTVELRHARRWQLLLGDRPAGEAIRALAWLGPESAQTSMAAVKAKLASDDFSELVAVAPQLPSWLARCVTKFAYG